MNTDSTLQIVFAMNHVSLLGHRVDRWDQADLEVLVQMTETVVKVDAVWDPRGSKGEG